MKKLILLLILVCSASHAQDKFVIQNVTIFDGDKIIEKATIAVQNGMIEEVSTSTVGGDFEIIDGSGKFLMPALSNAHVHAWAPNALTEAAKAGVLNIWICTALRCIKE